MQHTKFIRVKIFMVYMAVFAGTVGYAKTYTLTSPDKQIRIMVVADNYISWSISRNGETLLKLSRVALHVSNGLTPGEMPIIIRAETKMVDQIISAVIPVRNKLIPEQYNELKLILKDGFIISFRAYNDGAAYRFESTLPDQKIEVTDEIADFNFNEDCHVIMPQDNDPDMQGAYEAIFKDQKLSAIPKEQYGFLPLHIATSAGTKMVLTEADLYDYPNLFFYGTNKNSLTAVSPKVVLENKLAAGSDRLEIITKKANYIAKTKGSRTFPWRVLIISPDDKGLLETDLVYKLSTPNSLENTAWIEPGKVAWDWWNANNIYGVNFKAGINTETYKYYIDFAAEYKLPYIIVDEGWSVTDVNTLVPAQGMDMEEIINYAKSKNVGVILWVLWQPFDRQMDKALDLFVKWGAAGVKVDFMGRADQYIVNFFERTAAATARRHLLVDFHGAYKPSGLNRKYPNVINFEGVRGLEMNKFDATITPEHNVTIPFTRMAAGPMDYTPGAMLNTNKTDFRVVFSEPMSMGTRVQQAAMYVVYDGPLQMLADNPSNYRKEPEYTRFISQIPTVWDKTIGLAGEVAKYVVTARKSGNKWYIGAMTNWDGREIKISTTFLDKRKYQMQILQDGTNADKHAADYRFIDNQINAGDSLIIKMAPGGGWVALLTPID
ncbi:MAG TPA: glycoside hydrolase family 97 protein [Mucilaginibacter sp.]|jgi:alpha-glucosidase|nr:glycoside hydrolase family 97 protein [Mucilaginibacter sp.]